MKSLHEQTKDKAYKKGYYDAKIRIVRNSMSIKGSMWDVHYNKGYTDYCVTRLITPAYSELTKERV